MLAPPSFAPLSPRSVRNVLAGLALLLSVGALPAALPATAQLRLDRPGVRVDARYDVIEGGVIRERLQGAVRVTQQATFFETVDLVLFVATGDDFASRWTTFADLRAGSDRVDPFRPKLRRAYLQLDRDRYRLQVGVIPPVKAVVSPTGLDPAGWIDGVRFEWHNAPGGTVEFVAGQLDEVDTPSLLARRTVFTRPAEVNYAEVEVSQHVRPWLRLEGSLEHLRALYLRGEVRWIPSEHAELFTEALYNTETGAASYGTTVHGAPLVLWLGPEADRLTLELAHAYRGPRIGLRGELADDFITFGHTVTATARLVLSERYGLRGALKAIASEGLGVEGLRDDVYNRIKVELGWRWP